MMFIYDHDDEVDENVSISITVLSIVVSTYRGSLRT